MLFFVLVLVGLDGDGWRCVGKGGLMGWAGVLY